MTQTSVATTSAGWIRSVSPRFLELVGQPVEDLAAVNLTDLVHPHDAPAARRLLGDAGAVDFNPTVTLRFFLADGTWGQRIVTVRTADDGRRILGIHDSPPAPVDTPLRVADFLTASDQGNRAPQPDDQVNRAVTPAATLPAEVEVSRAVAPATTPQSNAAPPAPTVVATTTRRALWHERFPGVAAWLAKQGLSVAQLASAGLVVLFAFLLRTWDLSSLPTGFHGDEGVTGQEAERILSEGSIGVYSGSALGQPTGPFYLDAVTVGLFGNTIWATRILSAIAGAIAVAATYRVVERRFDHRTALASALALTTITWSIHFSRIAFGVAWWPLVVLLAVAAIDRAVTMQTRRTWFLAGGLSSLGVYIYNSHWSFGPVVVVFVTLWLVANLVRRQPIRIDAMVFGVLGALVIGLPMLLFIVNEDGFFNHFNQVSRRGTPEWTEAGVASRIRLGIGWYWESWRALFVTPVFDGTDGSGINKPIPLAFAMVAGVGLLDLARRRRSTFTAILLTTLIVLPASTILAPGAIARRTLALSPLVAILVGFGAIALIDMARESSSNKRAGTAAAAGLLAVALFAGVVPYFTAFRNSGGNRGTFTYDLTLSVEAIREAEQDGPVYVNWYSPRQDFLYPTIDFLLDDTPGESRARVGVGFEPDLDMTLSEQGEGRDQVFVLIGPYVDELDRLSETNPTGRVIEERDDPLMVIYEVPAG